MSKTKTTTEVQLGEFLFQFTTYQQWVNKGQSWFRNSGVRSSKTICLDARGRICPTGKEFMRADRQGAFPIRVYLATV